MGARGIRPSRRRRRTRRAPRRRRRGAAKTTYGVRPWASEMPPSAPAASTQRFRREPADRRACDGRVRRQHHAEAGRTRQVHRRRPSVRRADDVPPGLDLPERLRLPRRDRHRAPSTVANKPDADGGRIARGRPRWSRWRSAAQESGRGTFPNRFGMKTEIRWIPSLVRTSTRYWPASHGSVVDAVDERHADEQRRRTAARSSIRRRSIHSNSLALRGAARSARTSGVTPSGTVTPSAAMDRSSRLTYGDLDAAADRSTVGVQRSSVARTPAG